MPNRQYPRPAFDAMIAIHLALILILAWLGFILILPANTFGTTPAWRLFAALASEDQWAIMLLAAAMVGALGINPRQRWLKIGSVFILSTVHGTLALLFLAGNPFGGASGTFGIVALLGYYLTLRQARWGS